MSSDVSNNVRLLSAKLMLGWTLLSRSCPATDCNVPLVADLEGKPFCTSCDKYIDASESQAAPAAPAVSSGRPTYAATPTRVEPVPPRTVDAAAPTTSTPHARGKFLPADEVSPELSRISEPAGTEWSPPSAEEEAELAARRAKSDRDSAALGQRMLQGWTLLNEHCPRPGCAVPLVGKDGKMFCVSCETYAVTEAEFNASQHSEPVPAEPVHPTPSQSLAQSSGQSSRQPFGQSESKPQSLPLSPYKSQTKPTQTQPAPKAAVRVPKSHTTYTTTTTTAASASAALTGGASVASAGAVERTQGTLLAKLDEVQTTLAATSDLEGIAAHVAVITQLVDALRNIESLL